MKNMIKSTIIALGIFSFNSIVFASDTCQAECKSEYYECGKVYKINNVEYLVVCSFVDNEKAKAIQKQVRELLEVAKNPPQKK